MKPDIEIHGCVKIRSACNLSMQKKFLQSTILLECRREHSYLRDQAGETKNATRLSPTCEIREGGRNLSMQTSKQWHSKGYIYICVTGQAFNLDQRRYCVGFNCKCDWEEKPEVTIIFIETLIFKINLICKLRYDVFPVYRPPHWMSESCFHHTVLVILYLSSSFSILGLELWSYLSYTRQNIR